MSQKSHASHASRRFLAGSIAVALIALTFQALSPTMTPRANAASSLLCSGFSNCAAEGKPNHGYVNHWAKMFWRMFPYRNCVNYVAYKVIQDGGPQFRPWSGSGNATNWGYAMRKVTNQTPTKGAVAWWKAYAGGSSRYGHVAYVERVVSPNEIIISESNYGSNFSWRRITKGSGWPTGFIHFNDTTQTLKNVVKPKIRGDLSIGSTLRVAGGVWKPVGKPSVQWFADGRALPGETRRTLTLTEKLRDKRISARVTGTKAGYRPGTVFTAKTAPVGGLARVDYTKRPGIVGQAAPGETLYATMGGFWPRGGKRTFQWFVNNKPVPGATGKTFKPTKAQLQGTIRVRQRVAIPGYQVAVGWSKPAAQAKVRSEVSVTTPKAIPGRGVAVVRVSAQGATPTGKVTVAIGRYKKTQALTASKGYVWIGFDGMTGGRKDVRVYYHGNAKVSHDKAATTTWVRAKR